MLPVRRLLLLAVVLLALSSPAGAALAAGATAPAPAPEGAAPGPARPSASPDRYTRAFRVVLAGAVLLGLAGSTGLYLTRERS